MKKVSLIKSKKYVIHAKKHLVLMIITKSRDHCHYTGNMGELLLVFVI